MQITTLTSKRRAAPNLFVLEFTRPEGWSFEAGQFARIGLPVEGADPLMRAYSVASAPEENVLRFLVTRVEGGALSPRLTDLEPGETALLEGVAEGNLLPGRIPGGETLWLFATGSGLSPFLSMLRSKSLWKTRKDVVLVLSVRNFEDAAVARELVDTAFPGEFTLVVSTTREEEDGRRGDLSGRIPALLESGELEAHVGKNITPETSRVLLCGNPDFITATRAVFKERGIVSPRFGKPGQLVAENFW